MGILNAFAVSDPINSDLISDETLVSLARVNACTATVVQKLTVNAKCGDCWQKKYDDRFPNVCEAVRGRLLGTVHGFAAY